MSNHVHLFVRGGRNFTFSSVGWFFQSAESLWRGNLINSGIREDRINRMKTIEEQPQEDDLCGQVIGAAMKVHSVLGPGFPESVYQNALIWELRKVGLKAEAERPISVYYDGQIVGAFTADLLVKRFVDHRTESDSVACESA